MSDHVVPDGSSPLLVSKVAGESQPRFALLADGTVKRGSGSGALTAAYGADHGQAGIVAPSMPMFAMSTLTLVANQARYARVAVPRPLTVTKIAFCTTTAAGSDDAVDVAIYDSAGNRLVSSGATTGKLNATAGVQTVTITSTTLAPGVYYVGISCGAVGSTAAVCASANWQTNLAGLFGTTVGTIEGCSQNSAHPLPATISSGGATTNVPFLALRES